MFFTIPGKIKIWFEINNHWKENKSETHYFCTGNIFFISGFLIKPGGFRTIT
jgi:hypothetical protein